MAVGAARRDVLEQFLAEAVIISMTGGLAGIVIGVAIPLSVRFFTDDFAVPISPLSIIGGVHGFADRGTGVRPAAGEPRVAVESDRSSALRVTGLRAGTLGGMKLSSSALLLGLCGASHLFLIRRSPGADFAAGPGSGLAQNPDVLLARLDAQKAREQVTVTRDPFRPKVFAGSGAAWSTGFPSSIEGSAPSIVTGQDADGHLQSSAELLDGAGERGVRGAGVDVARRQEEAIYRVASLYLDAEQAARSLEAARRQVDNLKRVQELMAQRVAEGRELAIESKKANLAVLRANQHADDLAMDLTTAESILAQAWASGRTTWRGWPPKNGLRWRCRFRKRRRSRRRSRAATN